MDSGVRVHGGALQCRLIVRVRLRYPARQPVPGFSGVVGAYGSASAPPATWSALRRATLAKAYWGCETDPEISFLATWLEENRHIANEYPANIVFRRVNKVMADGVITDEERADLLADLKVISGDEFMESGAALPAHVAAVFEGDPFVESLSLAAPLCEQRVLTAVAVQIHSVFGAGTMLGCNSLRRTARMTSVKEDTRARSDEDDITTVWSENGLGGS